ncbi:hypothetical protein SAMN05421823_11120 [Catalinimonas alkaloidigena]|uniref:PepSY-associated TM region n=1 Tax=Catalinimonas alkaloidigena TaxID=1075417 RepID=A0A1G9R3H8_9BACT|nr:PepSY domain-containing protein [Catalinimonas alkaloidigena]SDM17804.1 hypothetical protein SAMN05421823_11120 [Catalinimonas alkaloidigena]
METKPSTSMLMRIIHRYLGFFLAGVMAVYAISGIVMIYRTTDFLKVEQQVERTLEPNLGPDELGRALRMREFKVTQTEGDVLYFEAGTYNRATGEAQYTTKDLPFILGKLTQLHKATTNSPLYFLNIFFGLSLLFFVISAFWMFRPSTSVFRKGLYFTLGGIALTLLMIFV